MMVAQMDGCGCEQSESGGVGGAAPDELDRVTGPGWRTWLYS
jgi:hypothetical protein